MGLSEMFYYLSTSELFDMFIKLVLVSFLAGIIGYEREAWRKPAGFRTYILMGISAVLVVAAGEYLHDVYSSDPSRIPAQLLSGIGFLGAGTILRDGNNIKGLTTAAGLLAVAAIGLVVGTGQYIIAILATVIVYFIIANSHKLSSKLDHVTSHEIKIITENPKKNLDKIRKITAAEGLDIIKVRYGKQGEESNEVFLELRARAEVDLNSVYTKISAINEVEEVVEIKNSTVPIN
jgi:putative Mg2+ transporter-C (MgtC) family protein